MTDRRDYGPITDEDLVAYLDGMLDDESTEHVERELAKDRALEERLGLLRAGERPFAEAFGLLLKQAPNRRLEDILDRALNPPEPEPEPIRPEPTVAAQDAGPSTGCSGPWGGWRVLAAAAVLLAVFAGGVLTSRLIPGFGPQVASLPDNKGWRAAVAEYQSLFVKATLENSAYDWKAQEANLGRALSHVGLKLDLDRVTVAPLDFKYAGILQFKGKPLVQLAYLYNKNSPVSFCIIRNGKPEDHGIMAEQRLGLNISHWQAGGYGYMVIGDVPQQAINEIAQALKARLS